jgi:hypothetical protein
MSTIIDVSSKLGEYIGKGWVRMPLIPPLVAHLTLSLLIDIHGRNMPVPCMSRRSSDEVTRK